MVEKNPEAFRNISEVSSLLDVPTHVLRFWETRFNQLKPIKRNGGRRYYRPEDIVLLKKIQNLLYQEGYTIKGAQQASKGFLSLSKMLRLRNFLPQPHQQRLIIHQCVRIVLQRL